MDTGSFFTYEPHVRAVAFLDDASEKEWDTLLSYMQTRHLRAGETIFTEGDVDRALYLLSAGRLEMSSTRARVVAVNAPAPVNEVAFLDGGRCAATARAVTDGELLRLSYDAFESLGAREANLARRVLLDLGSIVAHRLRSAEA